MHSRDPKVSVCIPVYNGAHYIAESIGSVLSQTYTDFRLIVSDNCSTDHTADIVRRFSDSRLTYVRAPENFGPVWNANRCLSLADGEYVCIWHHDDVMLPENLERKVHILETHPHVAFVHSDLLEIDEEGRLLREWSNNTRRDYVDDGLTFFHKYMTELPFGAIVFIGAVLARRTCYARLGGFRSDLRYTDDSEMWMRMSLFYDVANVGTPLVKWRQHQSSASSGLGLAVGWLHEHYLAAKIILHEHKDRIPHCELLRQQVYARFAQLSFRRGWEAYDKGYLAEAKGYLRFALRANPAVIRTQEFWRLAARLAAGPTGVRLYRAARRRLTAIR